MVDRTDGVLANDTDAEGTTLSAVLVTRPAHGTLTLRANGAFTYTHDGSNTTSDQFTYQAGDGVSTSPIATVTLTLTTGNAPPIAVADAYSVAEGATLTITAGRGVLANDTDPEGDPLTAVLVTGPTQGTLTFNANGSFTYVHNGSETTSDRFTYQASDGISTSAVVPVTLTITAVNDAPVARGDAYSVPQGDTLTVDRASGVLANDTDPEGTALVAVLGSGPTHGTLTLNPDGSFTYTHDGSSAASDRFTYQASDGEATSPFATVTLAIGANTAPVAVADAYSVAEGATTTVGPARGVLTNDTDADGDPLTALLVAGPLHGTLTLNPNGGFTYTHDGSNTTSDNFSYQANDGLANSNMATVTLTITAGNDTPMAMADAYSLTEGETLTIAPATGVLANDTDPDGDPLSAVLVSGPMHGTLTLNPDGSFTYIHDGSETTSDRFTYRANDGRVNSAMATVTLTITPVNDAPVAAADAYGVTRRGLLTIDATTGVLANDSDTEGDPLTAVLVAGPTHGTLTLNPDGGFTYTHDGTRGTDDSFTYRASDGTASSVVTTVTITVIPSNTAPVAVADTYTVTEGGTLTINVASGVLANDTDAEDDALTAVLVSGPTHGTLTLNADGSFTYTHDGSETTSDRFTYQANDGMADSPVATVTLTVDPVNEIPMALVDAYSVAEGGTFTATSAMGVLANDTDPDGDTLTAALVTGPSRGTLTLDASGGFTYTHDGSETTSDSFTYQASDGQATSAVTTVTLTITPSNDAPVAVADAYSVDEGATLTVNRASGVLANDRDAENDPLTAVLVSGPTHGMLTLNPDGSFTYTHDDSETTSDSFTYQASDGSTISIVITVTITVTAVNDAPVLTAGATLTYTENDAATAIDTTITVSDVDTATLAQATVQITGNYQASEDRLGFTDQLGITGSFTVATGTLTLTGPAALTDFATALRAVTYHNTSDTPAPALRTITWMADDGAAVNNLSAPVTSTVTITAVNDAPGFTIGPDQTVNEDAGPQSVADWATGITDGDAGGTQTLTFNVTGNTNASLFSAGPAVAANGTLTYTPETNANGTAMITLTLSDDGGTANGGGGHLSTTALYHHRHRGQ